MDLSAVINRISGMRDTLIGPPSAKIDPPRPKFISSAELEAYPDPASFVIQGDICDQSESPLFSKIPPEIRNEIFRLALTEYVPEGNDWASSLSEISHPGYGNVHSSANFVRRPGYEGLKTIDTDLLRTCKRAYAETKFLPLEDLEVDFYIGLKERAPKPYIMSRHTSGNTYLHPRTHWFKPAHWARVRHFHIFGQMVQLRTGFERLFKSEPEYFVPATVTLTLRYTDWYYWETNAPIYPVDPDLFLSMHDTELPSTVQKVTIEFESIEAKIKELDAVVRAMFTEGCWFWNRKDGRKLRVCGRGDEGDGVRTWRWSGPTTFGRNTQKFSHHGEGDTMGYVVKNVEWELE